MKSYLQLEWLHYFMGFEKRKLMILNKIGFNSNQQEDMWWVFAH
jgi:hypothetical protein